MEHANWAKWIGVLLGMLLGMLLGVMSFLVAVMPAEATELCRNLDDRVVCLVSINRSAKNYWEYRATVRVDGVEHPVAVYNCRDRIRVQSDGKIVPFEANDASKLVCRLYKG